jgi:hypothetical protein
MWDSSENWYKVHDTAVIISIEQPTAIEKILRTRGKLSANRLMSGSNRTLQTLANARSI